MNTYKIGYPFFERNGGWIMIPGLSLELHYLKFVLIMIIIGVIAIPREKHGKFFWVSLIWGYGGSFLFNWILSDLLHLYEWRHFDEVDFLGSNHWLVLAWGIAMMLYLRFLPTRKVWYVFPLYVLAFAVSSAALDSNFTKIDLMKVYHWNPFYRFILALLLFYGAAKHQWILEKAELKEGADEAK